MEEKKRYSSHEIKEELKRVQNQKRSYSLVSSVVSVLLIVSAISVLLATLWFPVLRIHGDSMANNLVENDYVVAIKSKDYKRGDVVAFYYNNKILIKRVIALEDEKVSIDFEGYVYINDKRLQEGYIKETSLTPSDIEYPHVVEKDSLFVLGDNRKNSIDSRNSSILDIQKDAVIGKLVLCVWPLGRIKIVK